jgi:phospholipase/lecithinase/hemolysin
MLHDQEVTMKPILQTPKPVRARRISLLLSALIFVFTAVLAHAQDYTSIVVFGDSLSDTGNVAHLTQDKYGVRIPGPLADYTDGRFTDGDDTHPVAQKYFGVWIEQLAATLPSKPIITNSLDGGTNYAYGFALTGIGTTLLTLTPTLNVTVNNIGQQITDYLATKPVISKRTLFVVWGGANDILNATSLDDVIKASIEETKDIQRLVDAGATQFIVPNLPPLGLVPKLNGSATTSIPATTASIVYNEFLKAGLNLLNDFQFRRHLRFYQLDVFSLFSKIIASPASYSLANVTDMAQGGAYTIDPDMYLFWDDLHPTTKGHEILAQTAARLLTHTASVPAGTEAMDR